MSYIETYYGRSIGAAAGNPLPVGGIVCQVGTDERVPEPGFAILPWDHQVLDQETGGDHADAVMHPTHLP